MAQTNKAHTTPQVLTADSKAGLLDTCATIIDGNRSLIADLERNNKEAKSTIVTEFGYGVFQTALFEVQVQRIVPDAKPVMDVEALRDFLATVDKRIEDFLVPGKPAAPHDRVNVTALAVPPSAVIHELGAHP